MFKAILLPRKGFNRQIGFPKIEACWQGVKTDSHALKHYHQALNLDQTKHLPLLYPHVLAGGMHMQMLTHRRFPIGLLGAVHLKNRITQVRPIKQDETMNIHSALGQWRVTEKGLEFDFSTQVVINAQVVWSETSTYFKRGRFGKEQESNNTIELETLLETQSSKHWLIPKNRGKVYAKISGDYNPIHISKILAKLFGLKRDIAHGFGILAQALASDELIHLSKNQASIELDTVFKGPLFLEEEAQVKVSKADPELDQKQRGFDIYCGNNAKPSICAHIHTLD